MKIKSFTSAVVSLAVMTLFGCGGGGGEAPAPPATGSVTISGVAAKGPLNGADVTVFAVKADGTFDRTAGNVGTGKTDSVGRFSILINPASAPAGAVVVEVTNGIYNDEASGTLNVKLTAPLRAVVASVAKTTVAAPDTRNEIAVTPFTEIAYKKAEGTGTNGAVITLTTANINDANSAISKAFGVDNIVTTIPFDPTNGSAAAAATASQKKYAGALGAFSQLTVAKTGVPAASLTAENLGAATNTLIKSIGDQVAASGGIEPASVDSYNTAVTDFNKSTKNQTGITIAPVTFTGGVLTISTSGTLPVAGVNNVINGIDMTLTLPAGVTVASAVLGDAAGGVIMPSSSAVSNSVVESKYTPATTSPAAPATLRIVITNVQPGFGV